MRLVRGAAVILLLAWAVSPELPRYRGERLLRVGEDALRFLVAHPNEVPDPALALGRVETLASDAARGLPADPRPWLLIGGSRLVRGMPEAAIESYALANARGERAETDLNLGRSYEALGDEPRSHAAFLRAVWISPPLLSAILPDIAASLRQDLARLDAELKAGRLASPPALPRGP